MQNDPSDQPIDELVAPTPDLESHGGVATVEPDASVELAHAADIDLPGGPWTPPVQEPLLDAELVAILVGEAEVGEPSPDAGREGRDDAPSPDEQPSAARTEADAAPAEAEDEQGGLDEPCPEELVRATAALLLASPEALSTRRLAELLGAAKPRVAAAAIAALGQRFEAAGLPFVVRELAGGWRLFTDPTMAEVVQRLDASRKVEKISPAALETLSIIAYRQPVTKGEIEAIRGVQAGPILRTLVDRGLVKVAGRAEQPGAPLLYGTTQAFLDRFGLASLAELPRDGELARD
jgi:segregation and condensation protein B